MIELTPMLESDSRKPMYIQIYQYIKEEIEKGTLSAGVILPSIRQLSIHLQISKNTVEGAYQQLLAEGYVESIPRVGLKVLALEESILSKYPKQESILKTVKEIKQEPIIHYDFVYGDIDQAHFPKKIWKKYLQEALEDQTGQIYMYGNPLGDEGLREELASYLLHSRGFRCEPGQIIITSGTQYAISLLAQLLSLHGEKVAFEEPGYNGVRTVLLNQGAEIVPISLEADGISISCLHSSQANLVYVTPSHQLPYGMILPIQKRIALLNWAYEQNGYIIEDDYDSEFRYQGKPIPALKALDEGDHVIYLGTFSKCFLPALRTSYLVLPPKLVELYQQKMQHYNQASSPLYQRALYSFMKNGEFEKHIRRMKKTYHHKHKTLLKAIEAEMGQYVQVIGEKSGLHILLDIPGRTDVELIEKAEGVGVRVYSTAKFWHNQSHHLSSMVMLGFGNLTENEINQGIHLLREAWFS